MITEQFPMMVNEEMISSEIRLQKTVENGYYMYSDNSIRYLVLHCSATRIDSDYPPAQMLRDHKARGFRTIGYHFYVRKDGSLSQHRKLLEVGAHCRPYNRCSIGICYEGGLDALGEPADTRTPEQRTVLRLLVQQLKRKFPAARVCGHRDLSPDTNGNGVVEPHEWLKQCPCFDVRTEL